LKIRSVIIGLTKKTNQHGLLPDEFYLSIQYVRYVLRDANAYVYANVLHELHPLE